MSFDTTVSYTGTKTGECIKIETALEKNLLNISCRHHVAKLVLEKVFALHNSAKSPNVDLLVNFRSHWPSIDKKKSRRFWMPQTHWNNSGTRDALIAFATEQLATNQPR